MAPARGGSRRALATICEPDLVVGGAPPLRCLTYGCGEAERLRGSRRQPVLMHGTVSDGDRPVIAVPSSQSVPGLVDGRPFVCAVTPAGCCRLVRAVRFCGSGDSNGARRPGLPGRTGRDRRRVRSRVRHASVACAAVVGAGRHDGHVAPVDVVGYCLHFLGALSCWTGDGASQVQGCQDPGAGESQFLGRRQSGARQPRSVDVIQRQPFTDVVADQNLARQVLHVRF